MTRRREGGGIIVEKELKSQRIFSKILRFTYSNNAW